MEETQAPSQTLLVNIMIDKKKIKSNKQKLKLPMPKSLWSSTVGIWRMLSVELMKRRDLENPKPLKICLG